MKIGNLKLVFVLLFTATNFNNLLQLVQPSVNQQTPQAPPLHQQAPPLPPPSVVSVGSDVSSDQIRDRTTPPPSQSLGQSADVAEHESLSSLLNEIVFLNQQSITTATTTSPGEEHDTHSPWLLQLDSDSDDAITTETEEAGLHDHTETAEAETQPGPSNGITTGSVVAPPPLLQMKVGRAKVADPASSDGASGRGGAWRPMPRLVPLGLRGAPPS